jgi:hypothetical protein
MQSGRDYDRCISNMMPKILEPLVHSADKVVLGAGAPGLLKTDWVTEAGTGDHQCGSHV